MDQNERLHREWIGMAQPEGLVVTASALKEAEANVTWPVTELQETLADLAGEAKTVARVRDLLREVLGWSDELVVEGVEVPASLRVALDGSEELRPTLALRSVDEADRFALVVMQAEPLDADLDAGTAEGMTHRSVDRTRHSRPSLRPMTPSTCASTPPSGARAARRSSVRRSASGVRSSSTSGGIAHASFGPGTPDKSLRPANVIICRA